MEEGSACARIQDGKHLLQRLRVESRSDLNPSFARQVDLDERVMRLGLEKMNGEKGMVYNL